MITPDLARALGHVTAPAVELHWNSGPAFAGYVLACACNGRLCWAAPFPSLGNSSRRALSQPLDVRRQVRIGRPALRPPRAGLMLRIGGCEVAGRAAPGGDAPLQHAGIPMSERAKQAPEHER